MAEAAGMGSAKGPVLLLSARNGPRPYSTPQGKHGCGVEIPGSWDSWIVGLPPAECLLGGRHVGKRLASGLYFGPLISGLTLQEELNHQQQLPLVAVGGECVCNSGHQAT